MRKDAIWKKRTTGRIEPSDNSVVDLSKSEILAFGSDNDGLFGIRTNNGVIEKRDENGVWAALGGGSGGVSSVNGQTGDVELTTAEINDGGDRLYMTASERSLISTALQEEVDPIFTASEAYNFVTGDKAKLEGIAEGAEVNVQSDWNQIDTGSDDYIKNKPTIAGGNLTVEVEIDFGSIPVSSKKFTIEDVQISPLSKILVYPSGNIATDRGSDDYEWDSISFTGRGYEGGIILSAHSSGKIAGKRKIYYTYN
jgi:hypothetical protein